MRIRSVLLLLILLLATALRLFHIDFRALWWDEGLSLLFARLDYVENARMAVTLADTNPPVYRLLLGVWINLVGSSAFAARLFSVLAGVVTVALVDRLGRALRFGLPVRLIAALLCAASPMLIYYSQEAKGYSLTAMALIASVVFWLRLTPPRSDGLWRRASLWAGWGFALFLAVGSHYIAAFFAAVQYLWTAALALKHWRGRERLWFTHGAWMLGAQMISAAALLPYVSLTLRGTSAVIRGETGEFVNLSPMAFVSRHLLELTQGPTAGGAWAWAAAAVMIGLMVVGGWKSSRMTRWIVCSWVMIPVLLGFALNLYHEFFFPRFVLAAVPAILLLAANGVAHISNHVPRTAFRVARRANTVSLFTVSLFIVSLWTPTLLAHYNTPTAEGEDWRPVADSLKPLVRAGDAAVYTWGWIPGYLDAYLPPAPQPDYALGFFTPESLDPQMQTIVANRERVWLFDYEIDQFDRRNMAGTWLRTRAALVHDDWPGAGKGHVALFVLQPTLSESQTVITGEFANGLRFTAQELIAAVSPGDSIALQLRWTPTQPLTERYTIFLHGLAPDGSLAFGRDSEPFNGATFATDWLVGQAHDELRGALIPPDLPPGEYALSVGLYHTLTGQPDPAGPVRVGALTVR